MSCIYCEHCNMIHDTDYEEMEVLSYVFKDHPEWKPIFDSAGYKEEWYCERVFGDILEELNLEY